MISRKARILEKTLRVIGMRRIISKLILSPKRNLRYEEPPRSFYKKYKVESRVVDGSKCVTVSREGNLKRHIIYFHGGAYTMEANRTHWNIVDRILQKMQCKVTFINYPLSPENTCVDTINMASEAYTFFSAKEDQEVILMGDSAGGGLALALAQNISNNGKLRRPKKLVLFSPWLDVSMIDEIPNEQKKRDLLLNQETLRLAGKQYAGELQTNNPLCSPFYGNFDNIGEIGLFIGTSEILHVQAFHLRDRFKNISLFEYERMQHVWIGFPIPEAADAIDEAVVFMEKEMLSGTSDNR